MPKYIHPTSVIDGLLDAVINGAANIHLITAYTQGDSYATVVGNSVASYNLVPGDFSKSNEAGNARRATLAAQSGNNASGSSGASPDLHFAITNGTDTVLYVTDETTDQVVTAGNPVDFPTLTIQVGQPV